MSCITHTASIPLLTVYLLFIKSYLDRDTAEENIRLIVLVITLLSVFLALSVFTRTFCFSYNGGMLTTQLRKLSLQAMLRQVIVYYMYTICCSCLPFDIRDCLTKISLFAPKLKFVESQANNNKYMQEVSMISVITYLDKLVCMLFLMPGSFTGL